MAESYQSATPNEIVSTIIDRRNESRKYTSDLWEEIREVYRSVKVRTKPIYKNSQQKGGQEEDKSRTNVAMPDQHIMFRRNVARYTAQPYKLRYLGGTVPYVAEALSSLSIQQYDRSRECYHDRRVVGMAEMFGFGYSKAYFDSLGYSMQQRKVLVRNNQVVFRDRASIMGATGAPAAEIQQAVQELGPQVSDDEVAAFIGRVGNELVIHQRVNRYEGPCVKSVFSGQLYLPPSVLTLFGADFVIEEYQETDLWLKKMLSLNYRDEDGNVRPAFDVNAVRELMLEDPEPRTETQNSALKTMLDEAVGRPTIILPKRLRVRRRYDILEQHTVEEEGRTWITWIAEKYNSAPIGRMPYPFEMYGHYAYNELVPMPDLISAYGDATPRLLRFLYEMHNRVVAQNFDYVTDLMKKFLLTTQGKKLGDPIDRGHFKEVTVEGGPGSVQYLEMPALPPGALERESQIMRMQAMAEPNMTNVDTGTASNPMAGKTATTAILASKASDTLTQYKLDGRDMYLRDVGQKKLWINQQSQDEETPFDIGSNYFSSGLKKQLKGGELPGHVLTERNGQTVSVKLNVLEIQDDLQVEPEAQSYLAVDDEIRRQAANELEAVAQMAPDRIDRDKVILFHLSTIRGIGDPDSFLLPPAPPPNPLDQVKKNFNFGVTAKFEDLPADIQAEALQFAGFPSATSVTPELQTRDTIKAVKGLSEASNAAAEMVQPTHPGPDQDDSTKKPE